MSGRDRRHYVTELRKAEDAHRSLLERTRAAFEQAYDLACQEWNTRQFIGGDAAPSPAIEACILCGRELLEVRCKRCGHGSMVDLRDVLNISNALDRAAYAIKSRSSRLDHPFAFRSFGALHCIHPISDG